jgi:serine/threonine-protein kinase
MVGMRKRSIAFAILCTMATASASARADPSALDKASAEALFQDGMKLVAASHFAEACPKLEESQRLDPAIGTQFRLAECYASLGRTASAWVNYIDVAELARNAGQSDRERLARERAAAVETRLSRLSVIVDSPDVPGLEVRRGANVLGRAQWGAAVPVDPGSYEITAAAPGRQPWQGTVAVTGDGAYPTITVPPLQDALAPQPPGPPRPTAEQTSAQPPAREAVESPSRVAPVLRTTGLITAGLGVVGLSVGAAFGFDAIAKKNSAQTSGCSGAACSAGAASVRDGARSSANVSTALFAAGGALAAGGLALWLFIPHGSAGPSMAALVGPSGLYLAGEWQ